MNKNELFITFFSKAKTNHKSDEQINRNKKFNIKHNYRFHEISLIINLVNADFRYFRAMYIFFRGIFLKFKIKKKNRMITYYVYVINNSVFVPYECPAEIWICSDVFILIF